MREIGMAVVADDGLTLAGTVTLPAGSGPHPAVVLTWPPHADREGDAGRGQFRLGRAFAGALAAKGVASYRFDRRGAGDTPGDRRATAYFRNIEDSAAALGALRARSDIGVVGAIGYSAGALDAAWLGAHAGAAAVVLIGATAQTGEEVYLWGASRWGKDDLPWPIRMVLRLLRRTPREQVERIFARIRTAPGEVMRVYGMKVPRSYRDWLTYDPKPDLAAIRGPVLAVLGDKDLHIDPHDLDVIARLVPGPVETRRVPDLTHTLRRDPEPASRRHYREQYARPVDPGLLDDVATWVSGVLAAPPT